MEVKKNHITLKNNETYYYLEKGTGNKVLILVHGNLSSSVHFLPLFNKLPDDIKVYAVDMRGFGDSSYHTPINSLKDLAEDLKQFADELGIKKASYAGWSTGGGVVLELAAQYPDIVDKIILIEAASHRGYPIFKKDANNVPIIGAAYETKEDMALDPLQVLPVVKALEEKNFALLSWIWDKTIYPINKPTEEENILYINESLKQRNLVDIDWALAILNMSDQKNAYAEGDNTIKNVKASALIIWSKNDFVVPFYLVDENLQALKDNAALKVYEVGGHSPLVDNLNELTMDILNFIK